MRAERSGGASELLSKQHKEAIMTANFYRHLARPYGALLGILLLCCATASLAQTSSGAKPSPRWLPFSPIRQLTGTGASPGLAKATLKTPYLPLVARARL